MLQMSWRRGKDFELFYRQWVAFAYNIAYRMSGNHAEAEEIVQDTFIRVYRFVEKFKGGSLKSWLYRIVVNLSYTRLQKNKVRYLHEQPFEQNGEPEEEMQVDIVDESGDPGRQIDFKEMSEPVQQALNILPSEQKAILILSDIEGLTYQEISDIVQCPVGTVRSRLSRARNMFRNALKHYAVKGGRMSCRK